MIKILRKIFAKLFSWVEAPHLPDPKENFIYKNQQEKESIQDDLHAYGSSIRSSLLKGVLFVYLIFFIIFLVKVIRFNLRS